MSHQEKGFTVIEVLIASAIAAIGFAAVFSLQIGTMQANIAAREMSAAVNLAEQSLARLHQNSFAWVGNELPEPLLNQSPRRWHTLTESPVDHNGRMHVSDDAEFGSELSRQRFCIHYWLSPLDGMYRQLMNARVRVVWAKTGLDSGALDDVCGEGQADAFIENPARYFTVTMPTVLRSNQ